MSKAKSASNTSFSQTLRSTLNSYATLPILLTLCFSLFGVIGILNHEMWRDELQAWMIARDSNSIIELFRNLRYEGHPGLWHLCLYFIAQFTRNPLAIQFFHLAISIASIYLFTRFSLFTRLQKVLFSFGYFPFYEYTIISRSYSLGILIAFGFCILVLRRDRNALLLSLLLALLANTSVYGLAIAVSLQSFLLIDSYKNSATISPKNKLRILSGLLIFGIGVILAIIQVIPPPDTGILVGISKPGTRFSWAGRIIWSLWSGFVPVPNFFDIHVWGTNISTIPSLSSTPLRALLSLGFLLLSIKLLSRNFTVLISYLIGIASLSFLNAYNYNLSARHIGHLFILLIIYLWLLSQDRNSNVDIVNLRSNPLNLPRQKFYSWFLSFVLWIHLISGIYLFVNDLFRPFSASVQAANFIRAKGLENMLMVGSPDFVASTLSGFLDRPIYYLESHSFGSFVIWNDRRREVKAEEVVQEASPLLSQANPEILIVSRGTINNTNSGLVLRDLANFDRTLANEELYLYSLRKASTN